MENVNRFAFRFRFIEPTGADTLQRAATKPLRPPPSLASYPPRGVTPSRATPFPFGWPAFRPQKMPSLCCVQKNKSKQKKTKKMHKKSKIKKRILPASQECECECKRVHVGRGEVGEECILKNTNSPLSNHLPFSPHCPAGKSAANVRQINFENFALKITQRDT